MSITSNVIILKDKFWNIVLGDSYEILLNIKWWWFVFPNNNNEWTTNISIKTSEWLKVFRLKSLNKNWNSIISVKIKKDNKDLFITNFWIQTVSSLDTDYVLESPIWVVNKIVVWKNEYKIKLNILWELWKKMNSRVYLTFDSKYWKINKSYSNIKNWEADFIIKTNTLAWKKIPLEIKIVWKKDIIKKYIDISPGKPMKLDLILSKSKMEASNLKTSELRVELNR